MIEEMFANPAISVFVSVLLCLFGYAAFRRFRPVLSGKAFDKIFDILLFLSFLFGISLVLGAGPGLQFYLSSMVSSSETNLYATAYGDGLIEFPSFWESMRNAIVWPFVLAAFAIFLVTHFARTMRDVYTYAAICCFLSLSLIDLVNLLWNDQFTSNAVLENFLGNFFGGLVFAAIVVVVFRALDVTLFSSGLQKLPLTSIVLLLPLVAGVFVSMFSYFATSFLYSPTAAAVSAIIDPPYGVYYEPKSITELEIQDIGESAPQSFDMLSTARGMDFPILVDAIGFQSLKWTSDENSGQFSLSLVGVVDCYDVKKMQSLLTDFPIHKEDVGEFEIASEGDVVFFAANVERSSSSYLYVGSERRDNQYWVAKEDGEETYSVSRRVGNPMILHYWDPINPLTFLLGVTLVERKEDGGLGRASRTVRMKVGGEEYNLRIEPAADTEWSADEKCMREPSLRKLDLGENAIETDAFQFGLLVRIERSRSSATYSRLEKDSLVVKTEDGIVHATNINREDVSKLVSSGSVGYLALHGRASRFSYNNDEILSP